MNQEGGFTTEEEGFTTQPDSASDEGGKAPIDREASVSGDPPCPSIYIQKSKEKNPGKKGPSKKGLESIRNKRNEGPHEKVLKEISSILHGGDPNKEGHILTKRVSPEPPYLHMLYVCSKELFQKLENENIPIPDFIKEDGFMPLDVFVEIYHQFLERIHDRDLLSKNGGGLIKKLIFFKANFNVEGRDFFHVEVKKVTGLPNYHYRVLKTKFQDFFKLQEGIREDGDKKKMSKKRKPLDTAPLRWVEKKKRV